MKPSSLSFGPSLGFLSVTERQLEARRRLGKRVSLLERRPPLETRAEALREHLKCEDRNRTSGGTTSAAEPYERSAGWSGASPSRQPDDGKQCRRGSNACHAKSQE